MKSFVQQELLKRGVLWSGFHNLSASHTDADVDYLLDVYRQVLPLLRGALERRALRESLRGAPVEPVFRRTGNFNMKPKPTAAPAPAPAPSATPAPVPVEGDDADDDKEVTGAHA
jgi:hypothetical protein